MKIGFVGTGIMGAPMARHLQQAGHELLVFRHRSPLPADLLDGGAEACATLRDLAQGSEVVITMLPDTSDVEAALFGADGIADGLDHGALFIDMSTISPLATKDYATRLLPLGADYLDAPVSGGEVGARDASLSIMVGGSQAAFERAKPLFDLMGRNVTHVGAVGDGQVTKVANQIIVALTIEAVAEGLLFASKSGADPATVRKALMGGFASSKVLEVHGERMLRRTFDPGFRIGLHVKDLDLAIASARTLGLPLPATAAAQQLLNGAVGRGERDRDHSAMLLSLEALAGHRLS
jgi:2-hydroxy-3-oxopropionate reductase